MAVKITSFSMNNLKQSQPAAQVSQAIELPVRSGELNASIKATAVSKTQLFLPKRPDKQRLTANKSFDSFALRSNSSSVQLSQLQKVSSLNPVERPQTPLKVNINIDQTAQRPRSVLIPRLKEDLKRPRSSAFNLVQTAEGSRPVEKSDYRIFNEIQLRQAASKFDEYVAMLPKFAEIYVQQGAASEKPLQKFTRALTQFEIQLISRQKINDGFCWTVLPMLFQRIPAVPFPNDLAHFASFMENNEYFRSKIEKDRTYITETLKKKLKQRVALYAIKVNTIADLGFSTFAQLYIDSFIFYYMAAVLKWITQNQENITRFLSFSAKNQNMQQLRRPSACQQKVFEFNQSARASGLHQHKTVPSVNFDDFNNKIKLLSPYDVLEQIMPAVTQQFSYSSEFEGIEMGLVFGLKSVLKLYYSGEIDVPEYKTYSRVLQCILLFLRMILGSQSDQESVQLAATLRQHRDEVDQLLLLLRVK